MLFALHGTSAIKVIAILYANFLIAQTCKGSKAGPVLTWAFNGFILYWNEIHQGHKFGNFHPQLAFLVRVCGLGPYGADLTSLWMLGRVARDISAVVRQLQHNHATTCVVQHGPLLGMQRCGLA